MTILTCLACGHADPGVRMGVVDLEEEGVTVTDQRVVDVAMVSGETRHGVAGLDYRQVRERYVSEPRCGDRAACRVRRAELPPLPTRPEPMDEPAIPAADAPLGEGDSWLL